MPSTLTPLDPDALLAPIPGENPAGADLRYSPIYDKIRDARRTAIDTQIGKSVTGDADDALTPVQRTAAAREDWHVVQRLVAETLTSGSKDLQLVVWLLEAQTYLGGFAGAATAFELVRRLIETYWEGLYPAIDDEDPDPLSLRIGVLEWIDNEDRLPTIFKCIPLSSGSREYALANLELAQKATDADSRSELANEGRPSADQFIQVMAASSAEHLQGLLTKIDACLAQVNQLEKVTDERFAHNVSFGSVRKVLEDCQFQVGRALRTKAPRETRTSGQPASSGPAESFVPTDASQFAGGDGVWDRALSLVQQGQLEGLLLAQGHIESAVSGRERFLRQLQLSELCVHVGMHAFAYPILDELGRLIDSRDLVTWEDPDVIRRTWAGLARVCKPLARVRPESVAREAEAQQRLAALSGDTVPPISET